MGVTKLHNIKLEKVDDKTAYENLLIKYAELENKIADIKANCDLAIKGRDLKIDELEKENERLEGDLELWESGGCRATNLFECGVVKELKEQLTKATEIIKRLKSLIEDVCDINYLSKNNTKLLEKAEQFLKEIEK